MEAVGQIRRGESERNKEKKVVVADALSCRSVLEPIQILYSVVLYQSRSLGYRSDSRHSQVELQQRQHQQQQQQQNKFQACSSVSLVSPSALSLSSCIQVARAFFFFWFFALPLCPIFWFWVFGFFVWFTVRARPRVCPFVCLSAFSVLLCVACVGLLNLENSSLGQAEQSQWTKPTTLSSSDRPLLLGY